MTTTIDALGIPDALGAGGAHLSPDGGNGLPCLRDLLRSLAGRLAPIQPSKAGLASLDANNRIDGLRASVADGSSWTFVTASTVNDPTQSFAITPADAPPMGRWLRLPGVVDLGAAFDAATPNNAPLITLPTNALVLVRSGYWKVGTLFAGGGAPALGLSSTNPSFNAQGDLLGGAAGDGVAVFGSIGTKLGTLGGKMASGVLLSSGDAVTLNLITSQFLTGAGEAHLLVDILTNPGV